MSDIDLEKSKAVLAVFKDDGTPLGNAIRCVVWHMEEYRARLSQAEKVVEAAKIMKACGYDELEMRNFEVALKNYAALSKDQEK